MGLDTNFDDTEKTVTTVELEAELAKTEYVQVCSSEKKKNKGNKPEGTIPDSEALVAAKASYENALKAIEAAKLAITTDGAKPFELYGHLLSDKARQL